MILIELKNGKRERVTNNVAHGLVENGFAVIVKEISKPRKDKMMRKSQVRTKSWT